jgi:uncharacterized protein YbjT (DUF2867 family)
MHPVLVTGATGRVGRAVVDQLLGAGVPVRALTRRPATAGLPATVEVVGGDLTVPESLDAALQGVGAVSLPLTTPPDSAPAVIERLVLGAAWIATIRWNGAATSAGPFVVLGAGLYAMWRGARAQRGGPGR